MSMRQQKRSNACLDQQIRKIRREIEELNMSTEIGWDSIYYTRKKTAEVLGISLRTLERWNTRGNIKRTFIGGRIFYSKREVLRVAQLYLQGIGRVTDYAVGYLACTEVVDEQSLCIKQ